MSASNGHLSVVPPGFDAASARALQALDPNWASSKGELSSGIRASYAVVRYRGKTWSIVYKKEVHQVLYEPTPGFRTPRPDLEVVIVRANPAISKRFYAKGWVDGSTDQPDCKSLDGVRPDAGVRAKQNDMCATCPQNAWGSKITENGKQAKACQDNRRIAVVPLGNLDNEMFGGPMLITLPPMSLKAALNFENQLAGYGYQTHAVAARLTFDPKESHPSILMNAIRPLTTAEFARIVQLREDPRTKLVLFDAADGTAVQDEETTQPAQQASPFEQPAPTVTARQQPSLPVAAPQQPSAPAPAPMPTTTVTTGGPDLDKELDSLFNT